MNWIVLAVIIAVALPSIARADGQPARPSPALACNPAEMADVCELKIQRNEGWDQLAIEKRKEQLMQQSEDRLAEYWKEYVDGDVAKAGWWDHLWWSWLSRYDKPIAKR